MEYEAFELSWMGASGGCTDLPMNNHAVVASTRLRLKLRHLKTAKDLRPEEVFIFAAHDKLVTRILARFSSSPYGARLDRLDLKPDVMGDFVSATDPWPLKPPPTIKGRLEIYGSFEPDGSHRGPSVVSLAYQTVERRDAREPKAVKGSVDIQGIGPAIELSGGVSVSTSFTAVAALDPQLYVDALVPGDGEFEEYVFNYLQYVADEAGVKPKELEGLFYSEYRDLMDPSWAKKLQVEFMPRFFELGAGQEQAVRVRVMRHGGPSNQAAIMVIRLRDTENRSLFSMSDFIIIDDDTTWLQVDQDVNGDGIHVRPR
ncbi:hypothetical protein ACH47V_27410 [Micromonospora chersina]|uniref:hypothetical protein n=1 Tax=Micromonospora chersina TaxID=47854 RepID=UPI003401A596